MSGNGLKYGTVYCKHDTVKSDDVTFVHGDEPVATCLLGGTIDVELPNRRVIMPVCLGCGSSYEDTFQFCPHCGRAKPEDSLIKNEVKQVKAKVEKTNVELEITRLRQEISELKNKREFMYSQNYAWIWGIVIIALLLVVLTFSSRFVFGGIIFLLIAGGAFWFAFKASQNKSRKIASYTVKINEKEAKVKLNLRKLD